MALLHHLCSPSISNLHTHQSNPISLPFHKPSQTNFNTIFSHTIPSLSLSFTPPQKSNLFLLNVATSSAHAQIAQEQEDDQEDKEKEEEDDDDEAFRTRLLAQNVPWTCTADDLRPLFEKYGTVLDIELSMYNKTRNRGLAFITMGSHEEALAAFNNLESYEFEGRVLKLNWAKPKKKKSATPPQPKPVPIHNLFVANLPFQARAKDLKEFFNADKANVVSAEIIFHENPRGSAGYGFVSFNTKAEAEAALDAFQGKEFMGRPIRVARSKRFLRQETKATIQSENGASDAKSVETSEKPVEA